MTENATPLNEGIKLHFDYLNKFCAIWFYKAADYNNIKWMI
jgi:hypothetical protein